MKRLESPWSRPMAASISYRTPAGDRGAVTTDGTGVFRGVNAFTVRWGRPAGYAQPNPGSLQLVMEQDAGTAPLPYGTRVNLRLTDNLNTVDVGLGWVSDYTRHAIAGGRQLVTLGLEDAIQRAANTRLQAAPWEPEVMNGRLPKINDASPLGPILDLQDLSELPPVGAGYLTSRDVDNVSALDVIRRSLPFGWTLAETSEGLLRPWPPEGSSLAWSSTSRPVTAWTAQATPVVLPLDAVEDPRAVVLDRAGLMTHCAVEFAAYTPLDAEPYPEGTFTYTAAGPTADVYTASSFTFSTDLAALDTFAGKDAIKTRAQLLVAANAEPVERWPAQRIALSRLTSAAALAMVSLPRHGHGLVAIAGAAYQVLAGLLTFSQGLASLAVELGDARQALVTPLAWNEIPARNLAHFAGGATAAPFPQLFSAAGTVTFGSTALVGNLDEWKAWT